MTNQQNTILIILIALCITLFFAIQEWQRAPDGLAHVTLLDIGQGDAIFIESPTGKQILVDGGPNLKAIDGIARQMSFFDKTIDLLVLSHPDLDHCFAFPEIVRRYRVQAILMTGIAHHSPCYSDLLSLLQEKRVPVIFADPTKDIDMGDGLVIDVLWPEPIYVGKEVEEGANNTSIVFRLLYGRDSILFTGDMEEVEENAVLQAGIDIRADILKVAHHGSKTSTSTGFLLAIDPEMAVISVGKDNRFGHPHDVIIDRLEHFNVPVRRTDEEGEVELVMDGV